MPLPMPKRVPEPGFYYHYKHDPNGPVNKYAYEVLGTTKDSENDNFGVLYRPLHEKSWFASVDFIVRPLEVWLEDVKKDGVKFPRFQKISDPTTISELERIRTEMYL
jgi:hypothetical protein